jgi:hypothetical protein
MKDANRLEKQQVALDLFSSWTLSSPREHTGPKYLYDARHPINQPVQIIITPVVM